MTTLEHISDQKTRIKGVILIHIGRAFTMTARNRRRTLDSGMLRKIQMAKQFCEDLLAGAGCHTLGDDIPGRGWKEAVGSKVLDVVRLVQKVRLLRDDNAHYPVAPGVLPLQPGNKLGYTSGT